jgi:hypothetical protein
MLSNCSISELHLSLFFLGGVEEIFLLLLLIIILTVLKFEFRAPSF